MYHDLAILMDARKPNITIHTTYKNAQHIRGRFYAYVTAWKHQTEAIPRSRVLNETDKQERLTEALHMEETMRRYGVQIQSTSLEQAELIFYLRDLDPRQLHVADQISSQIDSSDALRTLATRRAEDRAASHALRTVVGAPIKTAEDYKDSPIAELFEAPTVEPIDLPPAPVEQGTTDMTDLLTPGNQPTKPTTNFMEQALKSADKLRDKERKDGG